MALRNVGFFTGWQSVTNTFDFRQYENSIAGGFCVVFYQTVWLRSSLGVRREENLFSSTSLTLPSPRDLTLGRTRGGGSWMPPPAKVFLSFFPRE